MDKSRDQQVFDFMWNLIKSDIPDLKLKIKRELNWDALWRNFTVPWVLS